MNKVRLQVLLSNAIDILYQEGYSINRIVEELGITKGEEDVIGITTLREMIKELEKEMRE
jgi:hypothetical protein